MNRRAFFTAIGVAMTAKPVMARDGLHVSGTLVDGTSDLQSGYYLLCGTGTGQCKATDVIGLSVHPKNELYRKPLDQMVGREIQISIFTV